MAFEFDADFDRRLLVGSGIALGGYAVLAAGDPRKICEIYVEPVRAWSLALLMGKL